MDVIVGGQSDIGMVREENEDALIIHEPTDPEVRARKGILVALADGMGGLDDGSTASRIAVEAVVRGYFGSPDEPRVALEASAKDANRGIFQHSREVGGGKMMGSTLTALVVLEGHAFVAQVGDSRAYAYRAGVLRQVTKDHSLVRELIDLGRIEAASPQYAFHRNVLTRGLGLREDVSVDIYELRDLVGGDRLLLSSDGLHELVSPEEMASCLERLHSDVDGACRELINLARGRGGPDNITVAIVCIETEDAASGARDRGLLPRARKSSSFGWLIPVLVFGSFATGVCLTLLVESRDIGREKRLRLKQEVDAALQAGQGPALDADKVDSIKDHLRKAKAMLEDAEE